MAQVERYRAALQAADDRRKTCRSNRLDHRRPCALKRTRIQSVAFTICKREAIAAETKSLCATVFSFNRAYLRAHLLFYGRLPLIAHQQRLLAQLRWQLF